jgi:hypothetical protein
LDAQLVQVSSDPEWWRKDSLASTKDDDLLKVERCERNRSIHQPGSISGHLIKVLFSPGLGLTTSKIFHRSSLHSSQPSPFGMIGFSAVGFRFGASQSMTCLFKRISGVCMTSPSERVKDESPMLWIDSEGSSEAVMFLKSLGKRQARKPSISAYLLRR